MEEPNFYPKCSSYFDTRNDASHGQSIIQLIGRPIRLTSHRIPILANDKPVDPAKTYIKLPLELF